MKKCNPSWFWRVPMFNDELGTRQNHWKTECFRGLPAPRSTASPLWKEKLAWLSRVVLFSILLCGLSFHAQIIKLQGPSLRLAISQHAPPLKHDMHLHGTSSVPSVKCSHMYTVYTCDLPLPRYLYLSHATQGSPSVHLKNIWGIARSRNRLGA